MVRLLLLLLIAHAATAQSADPLRPSPLAMATARYKDSYLKITYGQPARNSRVIFGGLVPYNKVWSPGDNETTELTVTKDIEINGQPLAAGTYSLFVIPGPDRWTVILNSDVGQWGSYNYNSKLDVLRLEVAVEALNDERHERFTIQVKPQNDQARILLVWDQTQVPLSIQFKEPKP